MKRSLFYLATASVLALAACHNDDDDHDGFVYENEVVISNDANECPRADRKPCK